MTPQPTSPAAGESAAAEDPRRRIPRTDHLLALPQVAAAVTTLSDRVVRTLIRAAQDRARAGEITPEQVEAEVIAAVDSRSASSLRPVLNATGVIVHTNLGRAPLSDAARRALQDASGSTDVEFDLATGARGRRGAAARAALLAACPAAEDALIVNNGAAALMLACMALAGGGEVIVSRGELIEIGAGFRLPDLLTASGTRLREVGTTNRTHLADYEQAVSASTGAILTIHTSNYRVIGFTASQDAADLAPLAREHNLPLIADLGSGLLHPDPVLPNEPDATTALTAGADVVIASGDKLFGGPQAGIVLGTQAAIAAMSRHPVARAVRADKLTLAAVEATLSGPKPPVLAALHTRPEELRRRTETIAELLRVRRPELPVEVVPHEGRVGGGGGAEVPLPGWALSLPATLASALRAPRDPARIPVVGTTRDGACLLDLRCIPVGAEDELIEAVLAASEGEE